MKHEHLTEPSCIPKTGLKRPFLAETTLMQCKRSDSMNEKDCMTVSIKQLKVNNVQVTKNDKKVCLAVADVY